MEFTITTSIKHDGKEVSYELKVATKIEVSFEPVDVKKMREVRAQIEEEFLKQLKSCSPIL